MIKVDPHIWLLDFLKIYRANMEGSQFSFICLSPLEWYLTMQCYHTQVNFFSKHVIQLRFDNIIYTLLNRSVATALSFAINLLLSLWNQANNTIEEENLLCFSLNFSTHWMQLKYQL